MSAAVKPGRKPRPTTWEDVGRKQCEERPYTSEHRHTSPTGQIRLALDCPFCRAEVSAYLWSLSGGGKRCPCGALFGKSGTAYKRTESVQE